MSVALQIAGSLAPPNQVLLTTTNETDILAPGTRDIWTVVNIGVANTSGSARTITLRLNDGSTSLVLAHFSVPANDSILTEKIPMPLSINGGAASGQGAAKKLTAQANNANDLTVTAIYTTALPNRG